jgi:CHRD domain
MRRLPLLGLILFATGLVTAGCNNATDGVTIYQAPLTGSGEVPTRSTPADGAVGFNVEGNTVHYSIETHSITGVIGAHVHSGAAGSNGPIAIALYPRPGVNFSATPTGGVDGVLIQGSFQASDVVGISFETLLSEMRDGTAYANVHTTQFPGGEIRGQVHLVQ